MTSTKLHGDVLEILMDNPPVNALGTGLRRAIAKAVQDAQDRPEVKAIVLRGAGPMFSAGADIREFDEAPQSPWLPDMIDALEASTKPVVAAIHGSALGGGLELAMGCHYRLATPTAKLGLPEVNLGILPGAGGTQRLPRLIGVEAALGMIIGGSPISAAKGAKIGLIDKIVEPDALAEEAIAFARAAAGVRRTSEIMVKASADVFDRFVADNARKIRGLDAPQACIDAVRDAIQFPFAEAMKRDTDRVLKLIVGDQSKALRHAFFAERLAAKIDDLPADTRPRPIARVGIIGAGTMGGGIAMNFLSAGIPVTIVETAQDALDRGVGVVRRNYEASAAKGRLSTEQVESAMALLTPTLDFDALADADLVIEAVYENMELKKQIFARLDKVAKPGAILASNTSMLDVNEIAAATTRPQDVLGLHFFSPANIMKLLEVVRGTATAPDVLATAMAVARRIGKVAVVAGVCYGFIGNRMLIPRQYNALSLLLDGATPKQIDDVHKRFGMPMGHFEVLDMAGVDVGWHRDPDRIDTIQEALCAAGRWGQKTKAGYYDYDDGRRATPSPAVAAIIEDFRSKAGITPREVSEEEIIARTLYTMVNEGSKILEGGFAQRASDIDVVYLYGYAWPRHKGGPMFWAEQVGLSHVVAELRRYADPGEPDPTISPLLIRSAEQGGLPEMSGAAERLRGELGITRRSDWVTVDQAMIDRFADATFDHQYIHVDPARAAESPFGGTVAHGFLTLSIMPHLLSLIPQSSMQEQKMGVNYGFDRVRFVSPVRSGSRVRIAATLAKLEEIQPGMFQQTLDVAVEIEGQERPAIVAAWLSRFQL